MRDRFAYTTGKKPGMIFAENMDFWGASMNFSPIWPGFGGFLAYVSPISARCRGVSCFPFCKAGPQFSTAASVESPRWKTFPAAVYKLLKNARPPPRKRAAGPGKRAKALPNKPDFCQKLGINPLPYPENPRQIPRWPHRPSAWRRGPPERWPAAPGTPRCWSRRSRAFAGPCR